MKKVRSKLHPTEIGVIKTFSLSPNDEIGEIAVECSGCTYYYNNLAELCEKWEDYEEPETFWGITAWGDVYEYSQSQLAIKQKQTIGNYFERKEEAEKVVEKLKAWKRLKDKGFRFTGWNGTMTGGGIEYKAGKYYEKWIDDMNLIFGGEE